MISRKKLVMKVLLLLLCMFFLYRSHQEAFQHLLAGDLPHIEKMRRGTQILLRREKGLNNESVSKYSQETSKEAANAFNKQLDNKTLNEHFQYLLSQQGKEVYLTEQLMEVAASRTRQVANHSAQSLEMFVADHYPMHAYLLEQTYEKTLSTQDIHLVTWEQEEILAEFLYEQLDVNIPEGYQSHYFGLHLLAVPADEQELDGPAIRLVVVLLLDSQ